MSLPRYIGSAAVLHTHAYRDLHEARMDIFRTWLSFSEMSEGTFSPFVFADLMERFVKTNGGQECDSSTAETMWSSVSSASVLASCRRSQNHDDHDCRRTQVHNLIFERVKKSCGC